MIYSLRNCTFVQETLLEALSCFSFFYKLIIWFCWEVEFKILVDIEQLVVVVLGSNKTQATQYFNEFSRQKSKPVIRVYFIKISDSFFYHYNLT